MICSEENSKAYSCRSVDLWPPLGHRAGHSPSGFSQHECGNCTNLTNSGRREETSTNQRGTELPTNTAVSGVSYVQEVFLRWWPAPVPAAGGVESTDAGVLSSLFPVQAVVQQPVRPQTLVVSCRGTGHRVTGVDLWTEQKGWTLTPDTSLDWTWGENGTLWKRFFFKIWLFFGNNTPILQYSNTSILQYFNTSSWLCQLVAGDWLLNMTSWLKFHMSVMVVRHKWI